MLSSTPARSKCIGMNSLVLNLLSLFLLSSWVEWVLQFHLHVLYYRVVVYMHWDDWEISGVKGYGR